MGLTCCCLILLLAFLRHHLSDSPNSHSFNSYMKRFRQTQKVRASRNNLECKRYSSCDVDSLCQGSCLDPPHPAYSTYAAKCIIQKIKTLTKPERATTNHVVMYGNAQESESSLASCQNGREDFSTNLAFQPSLVYIASSLPHDYPRHI
jgi:hypothetical protein